MDAILDGLIHNKTDLRRIAKVDGLGQGAADIALRALKARQGILLGLGVAQDTDIGLCSLQVRSNLHLYDRSHGADTRVLDLI